MLDKFSPCSSRSINLPFKGVDFINLEPSSIIFNLILFVFTSCCLITTLFNLFKYFFVIISSSVVLDFPINEIMYFIFYFEYYQQMFRLDFLTTFFQDYKNLLLLDEIYE